MQYPTVEVLLSTPDIFEALRDHEPSDEPEVDRGMVQGTSGSMSGFTETRLPESCQNIALVRTSRGGDIWTGMRLDSRITNRLLMKQSFIYIEKPV